MPRPTIKAIKRKPRAVVNLAWMKEEFDKDPTIFPGDYDFEWFNNEDAMQEFYIYSRDFNEADYKDHGDVVMLVAEVSDTDKMTLGRIHVSPHTKAMNEWKKRVEADPMLLIYKTKDEKAEAAEEAPKATRGRPKSAAAQAAAKKTASTAKTAEAPKRQVRKPAAKQQQQAPAKKAAAKKAAENNDPDGKKAALQKRLAAKKAPAKADAGG